MQIDIGEFWNATWRFTVLGQQTRGTHRRREIQRLHIQIYSNDTTKGPEQCDCVVYNTIYIYISVCTIMYNCMQICYLRLRMCTDVYIYIIVRVYNIYIVILCISIVLHVAMYVNLYIICILHIYYIRIHVYVDAYRHIVYVYVYVSRAFQPPDCQFLASTARPKSSSLNWQPNRKMLVDRSSKRIENLSVRFQSIGI